MAFQTSFLQLIQPLLYTTKQGQLRPMQVELHTQDQGNKVTTVLLENYAQCTTKRPCPLYHTF